MDETFDFTNDRWGNRLLPYCSQCGAQMRFRRGGIDQSGIFWDCTNQRGLDPHDTFYVGSIPLPAKFDPVTGKPLGYT